MCEWKVSTDATDNYWESLYIYLLYSIRLECSVTTVSISLILRWYMCKYKNLSQYISEWELIEAGTGIFSIARGLRRPISVLPFESGVLGPASIKLY